MKKITQTMIFVFMIFLTTFIVGMEQNQLVLQETSRLAEEYCSHFARCHFRAFVAALKEKQLDTNDGARKHVVVSIVAQVKITGIGDDYYVAQQLARHNPEYNSIVTGINDAFKPEKNITDKWYANAIKYVNSKPSSFESLGHESGLLTPLGLAIRTANYEWSRKLIESGADVSKNYYDEYRYSMPPIFDVIVFKNRQAVYAVHQALLQKPKERYLQILYLLLDMGAKVNVVYEGYGNVWTPLMCAISCRDEESARALVGTGAELTESAYLKTKDIKWFNSIQ